METGDKHPPLYGTSEIPSYGFQQFIPQVSGAPSFGYPQGPPPDHPPPYPSPYPSGNPPVYAPTYPPIYAPASSPASVPGNLPRYPTGYPPENPAAYPSDPTAAHHQSPPAYSPSNLPGDPPRCTTVSTAALLNQSTNISCGLYPSLPQVTDNSTINTAAYAPSVPPQPTPGTPYSGPVPSRPAPLLPHRPPPLYQATHTAAFNGAPALTLEKCSFGHLKEGEAPSGCVLQWRGGEGLQLFFIQKDGHIVSPKRPLLMSVYKRICNTGIPEGMVEVHSCWRLRLRASENPVLHTLPDCYTFHDTSTCPSRMVVIVMPAQLNKKMSDDLRNLLTELAELHNEDGGMGEKVTTSVATVYDDLTNKLNTAVKDSIPSAHKSTKWLRKTTGSLVRTGGSLVARGIHIVADHMPVDKLQHEESPEHIELLNYWKMYKKCLEENTITYVN